jgi:hypothetical protein
MCEAEGNYTGPHVVVFVLSSGLIDENTKNNFLYTTVEQPT